jgi:HK97 family phage portal protein
MGLFDGGNKIAKAPDKKSILRWAQDQVTKMSSQIADTIRHIFDVKWSYSARRDALAYLELFHTTPRFDPVDILSTDCANTGFKVFSKIDLRAGKEDAEPVLGHPIYDLLDNPIPSRPDIDGFTIRYLTYVWWELQGDCYWIIVKDIRNEPREIYPIPSNWVISAPTISVPYFLVMPQGNTASQSILVSPDCVIWFKSPNVAQPYARGRGRAEAVGDEVESDEYAAKYAKNLFFNDGTPKSIVIAAGADQKTLQQLRENWNQNYQGVANAQKTAFIGADMKVQTVGISPKELDFTASRAFLRDVVNQHWQIPPEMFGILENSNRSTIDSARYLYSLNVLTKRLMRFDSMINRQLMPMYDDKFVIKSDNVVPDDDEFNQKVAIDNWNAGLITRGEARIRSGMAKLGTAIDDEIKESFSDVFRNVGPGGGALLVETNEDQQSGDDATQLPKPRADDNHVALDQPLPDDPQELVPVNGTPGLVPPSKGRGRKRTPHKAFTADQRQKMWEQFDKSATASEGPFKKAVTKIADRQQKDFDSAFNKALAEGGSADDALTKAQISVFGDAQDLAVKRQLYSSWMDSMHSGRKIANGIADVNIQFTIMQPIFRDWVDEHGLEKAVEINGTTQELLAKSLGDGIAAGEGILDLQKRLDDQFDGLRDYRSERIARTESAGSMNFGSTATYKSAGVEKKEWLAVQDDRTRDAHAEADGQVVGIDEPFVVDGEELMYPGDPSGSAENVINERCTILPVFEDQGDES